MNERVLNSTEIAEYLHCNVETARRIIRQGGLKAARVGRRYLVRESELSEYLKKRENNR